MAGEEERLWPSSHGFPRAYRMRDFDCGHQIRKGKSTAKVNCADLWVWMVKIAMVYHLHRVPSKQKMVFLESQQCHSMSNTWWGTGKVNHPHHAVFIMLLRSCDMIASHRIRRIRLTASDGRAV